MYYTGYDEKKSAGMSEIEGYCTIPHVMTDNSTSRHRTTHMAFEGIIYINNSLMTDQTLLCFAQEELTWIGPATFVTLCTESTPK